MHKLHDKVDKRHEETQAPDYETEERCKAEHDLRVGCDTDHSHIIERIEMILALSRSPIRALIENGLILKSELCDHSAEIRHGVVNVAHHIDKSLVKKPESRKVLDMSDICNLPKELVILSPDKGHEEALS